MKLGITSTKSAFLWSGIGKFGQYAISFGINIFLARLLTPDIFGLVGLLSVFTVISSLLIESGFRDALIRKPIVSETEYSSVFYLNVFFSLIIYLCLFFLAPIIASFYKTPILIPVSRILFFTFVINSLSIVQTIYYQKKLDFKFLSKVNVLSGLISGVIGVVMAYLNFGVWALVCSNVLNTFFRTASLWAYSDWRPLVVYSHKEIKELFGFSYRLLLSGLFAHVCANVTQLIIGKYYSISLVGYYDRAVNLQKIPMTTLSDVLNQVSYPLMANNINKRKEILFLLVKLSFFISVPIFSFLIVLGKDVIIFLLTEKWLPMLPYFQLLCVYGVMYPISILNSNILKINNYSDVILRNEIVRNVLLLIAIFFSYKLGALWMVFFITVINTLYPFIAFYDVDRLVYKGIFLFYLKTIFILLVFGLFSSFIIYMIPIKLDSLLLSLSLKAIIGASSYLLLIFIFQKSIFNDVINVLKIKKI